MPRGTRGIYADGVRKRRQYDVIHVGMARTLIRAMPSGSSAEQAAHFSIFEVFDNLRGKEIAELAGLLRHIYPPGSARQRFRLAPS